MTVAIANASNPTRVIMSTRPSVSARRPGAHTPSRAPASSVCTATSGAPALRHDPPRTDRDVRLACRGGCAASLVGESGCAHSTFHKERIRKSPKFAEGGVASIRRRDTTTRDLAASQPIRPDTRHSAWSPDARSPRPTGPGGRGYRKERVKRVRIDHHHRRGDRLASWWSTRDQIDQRHRSDRGGAGAEALLVQEAAEPTTRSPSTARRATRRPC